MALEHRLLIYVFRRRRGGVEYLIERRWPREEWGWSPIPAELGYTESLESAARRRMQSDWRAPPPVRLVDLRVCGHEQVGDLDLVEWGMGYGLEREWEPDPEERPEGADVVWRPLPLALQVLEGESARRALCRLHLHAAS